MRRRTALAGAGIALAGLGGCLDIMDEGRTGTAKNGISESNPAETEPERLAIGETADFDDGTSMTVTEPTVRESIIGDHSAFLAVERVDGHQFVVFDVDSTAEFAPSSFVLRRDGAIEEPPQPQQTVRGVVRDCGGTCIAVPVDVEAADSTAVAYRPDGELRAV